MIDILDKRLDRFRVILLSLAVGSLLVACGAKEESAEPEQVGSGSTSGNPLTAPVDYIGAIGQAQKRATKTLNLISVQQAIQQFGVMEGRHPKTLQELVSAGFLNAVPDAPKGMRLDYNPLTGVVSVQPQQTQ